MHRRRKEQRQRNVSLQAYVCVKFVDLLPSSSSIYCWCCRAIMHAVPFARVTAQRGSLAVHILESYRSWGPLPQQPPWTLLLLSPAHLGCARSLQLFRVPPAAVRDTRWLPLSPPSHPSFSTLVRRTPRKFASVLKHFLLRPDPVSSARDPRFSRLAENCFGPRARKTAQGLVLVQLPVSQSLPPIEAAHRRSL